MRPPKYAIGLFGLCVFAGLAVWAFGKIQKQPEQPATPKAVPVLGNVPEFALTDHRDTPFGHKDMDGRITVVNTFFSTCATICPRLMGKVAGLQEGLPEEVQLLSITVDAENDTPDVLAAYATKVGVTSQRWHLITGDDQKTRQLVVNGFQTAMGKPEVEGRIREITHSGKLYLVDRDRQIRGYFSPDPAGLEALQATVLSLL